MTKPRTYVALIHLGDQILLDRISDWRFPTCLTLASSVGIDEHHQEDGVVHESVHPFLECLEL